MKRQLFERIVGLLPRHKLENFLDNSSRPWNLSRKELEIRVIALDSYEMRDEIVEYITMVLLGVVDREQLKHAPPPSPRAER